MTNSRKNDSISSNKQNEKTTTTSAHNKRNYNISNAYSSVIGNSLSGSSGSIGTVSSSVYGYGGLPIAPPPSGNSANFVSTHIPPAQRAGPYIPYYPQAIKPS